MPIVVAPARRAWWFPAATIALVLVLMWSPVVASAVSAAGVANTASSSSDSLAALVATTSAGDKVGTTDVATGGLESALPKRTAPLPVVVPAARQASSADQRVRTQQARTTGSGAPATSGPTRRVSLSTPAKTQSRSSGASEEERARSILAGLIAQHPTLAGTTVSIGSTPGGYQAVTYYKSGRILVSPSHTASLTRILNHEIWHVIDWRDNGHIDWGENIPPK